MKIKKITLSTIISDLWKDDYKSHIKVGNEYWFFFSEGTSEYEISHKLWNKIKITYIRSGCLFYVLSDFPNKEFFCSIDCYMTSKFELAEIDPIKDLKEELKDIEVSKIIYRFDDKRTIVKNWPNEKEEIIDMDIIDDFGVINNMIINSLIV